jgi:alkylation response protein AidB-like acyl-CoA dehydrogenase
VNAAAAKAASTARVTAHEAVQLHGGMGMTSELPVSHYFKRLMVSARLLGDREDHLARFAQSEDALAAVGPLE